MKPVTGGETVISAEEDKVRKSLHELQPSAIDKETLVGADRMIKSTQQVKEKKKNIPTKIKKDVPKKQNKTKQNRVTTNDKSVQTTSEEKIQIEPEDLTCKSLAGPSKNYWQLLAEKRQQALKDALKENEKLSKYVERLEEENRIQKEMLNETRALIEVLQDMIGNNRNDISNSLEDSVIENDRNDINNSLEDSVL